MIARWPVWHVHPGEPGPGRHRLAGYPDTDADGPDAGLLLVRVPGLDGWELSFSDSDERFDGGWLDPSADLVPADPAHAHYTDCGLGPCAHDRPLDCRYERTEVGWWLVIALPDGHGQVWVHETDVPVDNAPGGSPFVRRPAEVQAGA